jgi:ATP-dependent exoDNAse (exonuclease V) alpha subunit
MRRHTEAALINSVYGSFPDRLSAPPPEFFRERAILAARNKDIRKINTSILDLLPGREHTYWSADTYSFEGPPRPRNENIPTEFLHSLNASGLPVAQLRLKDGCPVILLRNIDAKRGLCNGTRATVLHMSTRLLEVRLLTGDHAGDTALIPRISLSPTNTGLDYSIKLIRRQFPVQLALAMTINKAQGQTLAHIGIDLRKPVFTHGQLYVAFSRATSQAHINVLLPDDCTHSHTANVVYYEVLLD